MNPRLMADKDLQVATPSRDRGAAQVALVVLLVAVALVGLAQRGTDPGFGAQAAVATAPVVASPAPGLTMIGGTAVPAPPATAPVAATRARGGTFVYTAGTSTPKDALALFTYYLQQMPNQGWSLVGKGDPTARGDWTQRWQAGTDAALLTMTTQPRRQLTVTLCPPDPYC